MAEEPRPGLIVGGRYELIEVAGRGGMADVWRGRVRGDWGFVRDVAVKQMHQNLASQPPYVAMFVEEARLGSMLQSPNVAEVHDFVHDRGNYYMILEWIDGVDLGTWIRWHVGRTSRRAGNLSQPSRVGILRGLAAAHERTRSRRSTVPVIHRDVSPHNVLLTNRGMVKLIDFGLALAPDRAQETTEPGIVKGKMSYLAPEIVAGGRPVPASDQFACGSVLWEALVGRKLFDGATDYEVYTRLRDCMVQPLRPLRPDVPAPFVADHPARAVAPASTQRFPSAREMARQIGTTLKKVQLRKDLHTVLVEAASPTRATAWASDRAPAIRRRPRPSRRSSPTTRRASSSRRASRRRPRATRSRRWRSCAAFVTDCHRSSGESAASVRSWWAVALVTAACGDNAPPPFVPLTSGAAELTLVDDALVFTRNAKTLLTLRAESFQIGTVDDLDSGASFDPYWLATSSPDGLAWHRASSLAVLRSDSQGVTFDLGDGTLAVTPSTDGGFALTFRSSLARSAFLRLAPTVDETDCFYGLGEWGDGVEHRGKIRPAQLEVDTTLESSNNENHVPVPLVIGTRGWGLFVASDRPGVFDLGHTDPTLLDITFGTGDASADGLRVHLFGADAPLDILKPYYDVTGYPGLPATWAYGPLLWRDEHATGASSRRHRADPQPRSRDQRHLVRSAVRHRRQHVRLGRQQVSRSHDDAPGAPRRGPSLRDLASAVRRVGRPTIKIPRPNKTRTPRRTGSSRPRPVSSSTRGASRSTSPTPRPTRGGSKSSARTLPLGSGGFGVEGFKLDYAEDVVLGALGPRVPWKFADGSDERTMHYGYTMLYHRVHRELARRREAASCSRAPAGGAIRSAA